MLELETLDRAISAPSVESGKETLTIRGERLTISGIASVGAGAPVRLADDSETYRRMQASCDFITKALENNRPIYGVTTNFGGMADRVIPTDAAAALQNNLLWSHKAATGARLPAVDVRAGMLLRANSLAVGISGIRREIVQRFETFLNAGAVPHVYEFGSIGASGDQVPLSYISGSLIGLHPHFKVDLNGQELDCLSVLNRLGLSPIRLTAKEGLALINGTSVTTGIAVNCVDRARKMLALTMATHALFIQGLLGSNQAFHPFIHDHKAHPGQRWSAQQMLNLLDGSRLVQDHLNGKREHRSGHLIQDRYSVRCLPQFMGPIVDGIAQIARQVETEASSVTDNPLIDAASDAVYHCGNFLAQYIGTGMDQLRYHLGMMAKHVDVQIALLVAPEFNNGLPPSLVGNPQRPINTGLKALQLTANSIMPMISFYGNSIADRFPTHAEQFNQNINSQGFGSASLARRSVELFEQYAAVALMFAVQAVDLRAREHEGHYDARRCLSPATSKLYEAVRHATGRPVSADRPFLLDDSDYFIDEQVASILADITSGGRIHEAVRETLSSLETHRA
jgi:phenylalanine ammonia-lyase